MANVLELVDIRKSFGKELVLNHLSLSVPEHTATVLIGASGSGKSTLLRCINLLESIDDGQIFLDGSEISDPLINVDEVRRKLGMVFQSFNLFPHKTVLENITLAPIKVQGKTKEVAIEIAQKLLKRFDLADKADQYPDRLSGGQQQRVAIIRSLAINPRLLLLVEIAVIGIAPCQVAIPRVMRVVCGNVVLVADLQNQLTQPVLPEAVVLRHGAHAG